MKLQLMFQLSILFLCLPIANAADPVQYKEKGFTLTEDAYIMTPSTELEARIAVKEVGLYKVIVEDQSKQLDIYRANNLFYEERLNNFRNQNDELAQKLTTAASSNKLENALYFLGGAIITGAMGYGIYKAASSK